MLVTCFSTARSVTTSCDGDRVVRAALRHQPEHLALARAQLGQRVLAPAAAEQARDDLGVERAAALPHAPHRVDEALEVGDAVLEQVADALGVRGEQLHRVALLDVLREDEHADAGVALAGSRPPPAVPRRCASAACGRPRSRRPACARRPCAAGPRRRRPARPRRGPRPRAAARRPRGAAGCHRPGLRACRTGDVGADQCASSGWGMDLESAVERGQAVGQAAQTGSGGRVGAADPIIADLDDGKRRRGGRR